MIHRQPFPNWSLLLLTVVSLVAARPAVCGVGDPTIETDHQHYPGEGRFQTIESCVEHATKGHKTDQDKAIALFRWILAHQFHLKSPQEWNVPGLIPNTKFHDDQFVFDANRARFSYSYGLCGTVHAWNEPYWHALGMEARRRAFPKHINSEVFYDNSWHAFDTDLAGLVFRDDGVVAGYEDICRNLKVLDNRVGDIPSYPFAWPRNNRFMKRGWKQVAEKSASGWYSMYNCGYAAHPGIVHLRSGETFTRYFDRDHFGGPSQRRFWHIQEGGPFRSDTFVNIGSVRHVGEKANCRGNASYCNGVFEFTPNLANREFLLSASTVTGQLAVAASSPRLKSQDGEPATVTFGHFSPYVICGDPVDDTDSMTNRATDGLILTGRAVGSVRCELSNDGGQTWLPTQTLAAGSFRLDLTEQVKGRYGWQLRFTLQGDSGLDAVTFTTTTQVAQPIYPRLTPNGCTVTYRAGNRAVVSVLPNWSLAEPNAFEHVRFRGDNIRYTPRSPTQRLAYRVTDNKPGQIVFRIRVPSSGGSLQSVSAGVRYLIGVPTPPNSRYQLEVSIDEGKTWKSFADFKVSTENEYSSGWVYGTGDLSQAASKAPGPIRSALVRVTLYGGGRNTGLIDAKLYGVYATPDPQKLTVTCGWFEEGQLKTHSEDIPAGQNRHTFQVPTGSTIRDSFVRIGVPDS